MESHFDFIELAHEYPMSLAIPEKEDYFLTPISVAAEMGLKTAIYTSITAVTPQRKEVINNTPVFRFGSASSMLNALRKSRAKLVHGHGISWIPVVLSPFVTKKFVLTPHMYKLDVYPNWKVWPAMQCIKKSEALVVLTEFEAAQFRKVMKDKVHVIPHPIDCEFFSPSKDNKNFSSTFRSKKTALCVSNLFPIKNIKTLIRSFATVAKTIPEANLMIVGGEPKTKLGVFKTEPANWNYHLELVEYTASLGLTGKVVFTGHKTKSELLDLYRSSDVFCLPSTRECQSLAAGEAAACGVPLVMSNLEPLREIYDGCALFHDPMDYELLAENILAVFQNSTLAESLGKRGHEKMLNFHPEIIRTKLRNLYTNLLCT